jgi:hypothetical protein
MMKPIPIIVVAMVFLLFLSSGCIKASEKLGCCRKSNATGDDKDGCVMYNMTDQEFVDMRDLTSGSCDDEDAGTDGHCNVSVNGETGEAGDYHLIPICTEDDLGDCFYPDCKAMVCGDFVFKPRVAPGFSNAEEAQDQVPPETEGEDTENFYEAQCRFLNMDTRLKTTMKNSNSQINVFRIGVGRNFKEFDQYRYYFPMSDRYCNINPAIGMSDIRIDRYMNYIGPGFEKYDPNSELDVDCITDSADVPPPFQFGFSNIGETQNLEAGIYMHNITNPDRHGYRFKEYANAVVFPEMRTFDDGFVGEENHPTFVPDDDTIEKLINYKKIDEKFYRKALSLAYSDEIFGGAGRAPFECDMAAVECFSGDCNDQVYDRGMLLAGEDVNDPDSWEEVDGGCTLEHDNLGNGRIICFPMTDFDDDTLERDFASADFTPWLMRIEIDEYDPNDINEDDVQEGDKYGCCGEKWCYQDRSGISDLLRDECEDKGYTSWNCREEGAYEYCDCEVVRRWPEGGGSEIYGPPDSGNYESKNFGKDHICQLRWEWSDITGRGWYNMIEPSEDWARARWGQDRDRDAREGYYKDKDAFDGVFRLDTIPEDFGFEMANADMDSDDRCPDGYTFDDDSDKCYRPYVSGTGFAYPPASRIEFFGEFGDEPGDNVVFTTGELLDMGDPGSFPPVYDPEADPGDEVDPEEVEWTMLGYALMDEEELEDTYLYEACDLGREAFVDGIPVEKDYSSIRIENPTSPIIRSSTFTENSFDILMESFLPYLENRIDNLQHSNWGDGEGNKMGDGDIILTTVPWIVALKQGEVEDNVFDTDTKFLTGPGGYYLDKNVLEKNVPPGYVKSSGGNLRMNFPGKGKKYYTALMARDVTLFFDRDGDGRLGRCVIDDEGLPEIRSFGWCEPCTVMTLAPQEMHLADDVYMPYGILEMDSYRIDTLCKSQKTTHGKNMRERISCFSENIKDIQVYNGLPLWTGSPRSDPEAAFMKEKLEIYMRSGIMPVLDMSDDDYWDLSSSWGGSSRWDDHFINYDHEALLDNKGAMIVIVDTVSHSQVRDADVDVSTIQERAGKIRLSCPRCLTALAIRTGDNETFRQGLSYVFADPRTSFLIDMVAADYSPIWGYEDDIYESETPEGEAVEVVQNMASYARLSLTEAGKPTIITKFYVSQSVSEHHGGSWNEDTFDTLFQTIILNQDTLVKSGIYGIIFNPVRSDFTISDSGLVDYSSEIGSKTKKFCALEQAGNLMTSLPDTAMFTALPQQNMVNCTNCTSLEIATGLCDQPDSRICDNGVMCDNPGDREKVRCPDNTIKKPSAGNCQLCSELDGIIVCDYNYINGTTETKQFDASNVRTAAYADVMAGLEKPNKCCIVAEQGEDAYVSYGKMKVSHSINRPMVYSESGNQQMDCGVTSSAMSMEENAFCGYELPVKEYDINCTFVEGASLPSGSMPTIPDGYIGEVRLPGLGGGS